MSTEELENCIISGMVTFGYNCIFRTLRMLKLKIPYEMMGFTCWKARMILSSVRSPTTITAILIIEVNESCD